MTIPKHVDWTKVNHYKSRMAATVLTCALTLTGVVAPLALAAEDNPENTLATEALDDTLTNGISGANEEITNDDDIAEVPATAKGPTPTATPTPTDGPKTVSVARYAGSTRYETAVEISKNSGYGTNGVVYLTRGDVTADALVAGSMTAGPVLLIPPKGLNNAVKAEIDRLNPKIVVVVGGTSGLPDNVVKQYTSKDYTRLAGKDRFGTAVAVSQFLYPDTGSHDYKKPLTTIYVTNGIGNNPKVGAPDGVVGGVLPNGPILTVNPKTGPTAETRDEIARLTKAAKEFDGVTIVSLGNTDLKMTVDSKLGGSDRYKTAYQIGSYATKLSLDLLGYAAQGKGTIYLANGQSFVDAIAGGTVNDGPIFLVEKNKIPEEVCTFMKNATWVDKIVAFGGTAVVNDSVLTNAKNCAETATQ